MIAPVSKSLPLRVWDRHADRPITEWMKDSPQTYESYPRGSFRNWLESLAFYDWMIAAYENSRWSVREIQPFIEEHDIDMSEFEPVRYRSFAVFFLSAAFVLARGFSPPIPKSLQPLPRLAISVGNGIRPIKNFR